MNKKDFLKAALKRSGCKSLKSLNTVFSAICDEIVEVVAAGDTITLYEFGKFSSAKRKVCVRGFSPSCKEDTHIVVVTPRFHAAKRFKDAVKAKSK